MLTKIEEELAREIFRSMAGPSVTMTAFVPSSVAITGRSPSPSSYSYQERVMNENAFVTALWYYEQRLKEKLVDVLRE